MIEHRGEKAETGREGLQTPGMRHQGVFSGKAVPLRTRHGPPVPEMRHWVPGETQVWLRLRGLHGRALRCAFLGQTNQHDVIVVVLGSEVLVEPRVREEVCGPANS